MRRLPARILLRLAVPAVLALACMLAAPGTRGNSASTPVDTAAAPTRYGHQPLKEPYQVEGQPNLSGVVFRSDSRKAPSFGFSADRWWAILDLHSAFPGPLFLKLDAPSANRILAFMRCAGGAWTGLARIPARYAVFRAQVSGQKCQAALLQESSAPIRFGIEVLAPDMLAGSDDATFIGVALGVSLAVSAMVAFLWTATRARELPHFLAYQTASAVVILYFWGFVPGVLFRGHPAVGGIMGVSGFNIWVVEFLAYVRFSLGFPASHPRLDRWTYLITASACVAVAGEVLRQRFQWPLTIVNMGGGLACWITVIILKWPTDRKRATQQLLGYAPTILCFLLYLGSVRGGVSLAELRLLLLMGQVGTTVSLGFWMAQAFKSDRDAREAMLSRTVGQLNENRAELERYQGDLETMVSSRTAELQRAVQSERAIVAQQRDFTAMIGHEFRTPLAVIDGQARRIGLAGAEDDLLRRSREIRNAVGDMISLMDGLLFHARSDSGAAEYRFEMLALRDIVQRAVETALPRDRQRDLHVVQMGSFLCRADESLLVTALGNVIANAAKYSRAGTRIDLEIVERRGMLEIQVRDQGQGISPAEVEAIFARFQRGSNALTSIGSGLGLYVARQIVEGHGGTIQVESMLGEGSCFTLCLPCGVGEAQKTVPGIAGAA